MTAIQELSVTAIDPGNNDRREFAQEELEQLARSIARYGLAQPIVVRPRGDRFEIVAGERRFRAVSQVLQAASIPAIVRDLEDQDAAGVMLAENLQRVQLNPMEEANAYGKRMASGSTISELAQEAHVSESRIRSRLRLTKLVEDAQKLVATGQLGLGFAEALSNLDVNRQRIALRTLNHRNPTLGEFRTLCGELLKAQLADEAITLFEMPPMAEPSAEATAEPVAWRVDAGLLAVKNAGTATDMLLNLIEKAHADGREQEQVILQTALAALIRANCARPPKDLAKLALLLTAKA